MHDNVSAGATYNDVLDRVLAKQTICSFTLNSLLCNTLLRLLSGAGQHGVVMTNCGVRLQKGLSSLHIIAAGLKKKSNACLPLLAFSLMCQLDGLHW